MPSMGGVRTMSTTKWLITLLCLLFCAPMLPAQTIIEQDGNVGIGTPTPNGRLHIVGSADNAGTLRFQPDPIKGTDQSHVHWGPTGDWYIRSARNSGKVVIQDTGGGVAIGT